MRPFEGVDALAAGALKELLARMTERGVTIFLTFTFGNR